MERCASIFSPAGVLFAVISVMMISVAASAQTAEMDTSAGRTFDSSRVTINLAQDTAGRAIDTLSAKGDTARSVSDSLSGLSDTTMRKKDTLEILTSNASYNTIPGFRVQVLTTQTLDKAIKVKAEADSLLPNYNVYIVYDSPYYKVRIGNFRARYEANQAVTYIAGHGFPSAWLVPDNVFRNPVHRSN